MNTKSGTKIFEDVKINVKIKLAALWVALMFLYVYADILGFYAAGHIEEVIAILKNYEKITEANETGQVRKCLRYIENRPGQFKYKEAIAAKLPIGSGEIESGNRSVVQKRLKIPGAWWKHETAEWMLSLRCMRMNGDWERYWHLSNPSFARAA